MEAFRKAFWISSLISIESTQSKSALEETGAANIPTEKCCEHPDKDTQFCCMEPGCGGKLICELCLVGEHSQHRVGLVPVQCEKIIKEVSKAREEESAVLCDKVQCVLSIRDKLVNSKQDLHKKISEEAANIHKIIDQRKQKLKNMVETKTEQELLRIWDEAERLLKEQGDLEKMTIHKEIKPSHILEKGPKLMKMFRKKWLKQPWSFQCEVPDLPTGAIQGAVRLGVMALKTRSEVVTSSQEKLYRKHAQVSR